MHAPATHQNVRTTGRHRIVDDRDQRKFAAFRLDTGPGATPTGAHGTATYARYVGRIGALAVALGVGAALATGSGAGLARADDGSDSSTSGGGSTSDSSATSTSSDDSATPSSPTEESGGTTQPATGQSGSAGNTSAPRPTVPDMKFNSSGGAHTSTNGSTASTATTDGDGDGAAIVDVDTPTVTIPDEGASGTSTTVAEPKTPGKRNDSPAQPTKPVTTPRATDPSGDAHKVANQQPAVAEAQPETAPVNAPAVATGLASAPDVIEPETPEVPAEKPSVVATMLAAAIAPFLLPGPNAPAASPLLWAVMAWTRREAEQTVETPTPARATEVPTAALAAADYFLVTNEDVPLTGTLPVLLGLLNPIQVTNQPVNGTLTVSPLGEFVYVPNLNFHGQDSFTYVAQSLLGLPLATATVAINVLPVNDAPVGSDTSVTTDEDTTVTGQLPPATDADGDAVLYTFGSAPAHGIVGVTPTGVFTYIPDADYNGTDSFTYFVSDGQASSSYTVTIQVTPVNDAPVGSDISISATEGDSFAGQLPVAIDPEGDAVTYGLGQQPSNGTVTISANGSYTYTPATLFSGPDSFTYTVSDGVATATYTVVVAVAAVNHAPTASDASTHTPHGVPTTVVVLAADPDGDPLTFAIDSAPQFGTVTIKESSGFYEVTYTPEAGFSGTDEFTYFVTDPSGLSAVGTITVHVLNGEPVANADVYVTTRDTVTSGSVLTNDQDPDGDPLTVVSFGPAVNGTLTWNADGSFSYTPSSGFVGYDEFTYVVSDSVGATSVGHVLIVVEKPANTLPVVVDHALVTEEGIDVGFDPLAGLEDPDGDPLVARVGEQPLHGFAQQTTDGTIFYVPDRDFVGTDSFTYTVFDGYQTVEATVTITVGPSTRPIAVDDEVSVAEGGKVTIDVLKNDVNPRGDALQVKLIGEPSYGKVEYNEKTRTFVYTAGVGHNIESDSFSYEVTDKDGRTSTATVNINIDLKVDGPEARDDWASTPVNTSVVIDVLANDFTPGEKPPVVRIDSPPRQGKAEVLKDGTISYTPDKGFTGTVVLGYSVTDSAGNVSHATVTVTVYDGGENPNDKWFTIGKDRTLTVSAADGLLSGLDAEGWSLGVEVKPRNGTLTLNQDGSFTYTPNKGFVGKDTFDFYTYTSEWGDGPFTVTIEVTEATSEPNPEANYGTTIALSSSSAFGTCGDNLMPGQGDPESEWPTCLFTTAARRISDPW